MRFLVMGLFKKSGVSWRYCDIVNDLKKSITLDVRSFTTDQLRYAVEHAVHRLEILQVNEGGHVEYLSLHGSGLLLLRNFVLICSCVCKLNCSVSPLPFLNVVL
ncbi:hypothetical protein TNIN_500171 [Trichonephila inaurata madagascariensis]|uniref:Uncharacterized protein n=1 Tax=Trichonephila inaurata madagascariensis TaxID=2747483 RepID=A0A8X7CCW2_9ARAC|nr:hypothetical protein TNIN_500171 [Trichonephila inaurata madagascariensis]